MSQPTFFSHIESLGTGSLSFEAPLLSMPGQVRVCRYQGHRAEAADLTQTQERAPLNQFAAWLPHAAHGLTLPQMNDPWFWQECEIPIECFSATRLHFDARLPINLALPFIGEFEQAFAVENRAFTGELSYPESLKLELVHSGLTDNPFALQAAIQKRLADREVADLGIWGNPVRSEGFKLLGLAIAQRFTGEQPVVVVRDQTGELLWGLILAAQHYLDLKLDLPYRVALVQQQPYDDICRSFEGQMMSWEAASSPPEVVRGPLISGLQRLMGMAVSIEPDQTALEESLHRLSRGMVIEEEDDVVLLGFDR
jgi:hypothetical protein